MTTHHTKIELTTENFPALHTFLRGYFHEDVRDEYGSAPEAADQFCEDAESDERIPVAREWQKVVELTEGHVPALNAALKKLGAAIQLTENQVPEISAIFARCLGTRTSRRAANE
ncbi:MAG TPA: contact-dependent growth inhibition system immunity protein [Terriglobales bacterium]|nr:contact-dependent growth inhibition system immunity protein [Terriglobales bacterium]